MVEGKPLSTSSALHSFHNSVLNQYSPIPLLFHWQKNLPSLLHHHLSNLSTAHTAPAIFQSVFSDDDLAPQKSVPYILIQKHAQNLLESGPKWHAMKQPLGTLDRAG